MTTFIQVPDSALELWKPVPGYPDYEVSSHGRVRRCGAAGRWAAGHVLRPGQARSGHLFVLLTGPNRRARKELSIGW